MSLDNKAKTNPPHYPVDPLLDASICKQSNAVQTSQPDNQNSSATHTASNLKSTAKTLKTPSTLIPGTLLRINQFIPDILPIAKSTFWAGVKSGKYPKSLKLSERITCWRSEDIMAVRDNNFKSAD